MTPKAPAQVDRRPNWRADLPLVVCKGGPRAGAWYFADHGPQSWAEFQRLARAHWDLHGPPTLDSDTVLGYVDTGNTVDHPRYDGPDGVPLTGQVLLWSPDRGAARERKLRQNGE